MENPVLPLQGHTFLFFPDCGELSPFSTAKVENMLWGTFPQIYPGSFNVDKWKTFLVSELVIDVGSDLLDHGLQGVAGGKIVLDFVDVL